MDSQRIANVILDERSVARRSPQIEHERRVAIYDLLEDNRFFLTGEHGELTGPYHIHLSIAENRLNFDVRDTADAPLRRFGLSLTPFRKIFRDYNLVCESYYDAIKTAGPSRIEAIDMGRRGLHNEGAELLRARLDGKASMDENTARRLYTLIYVLQMRG